ncbi:MAG TPA: 8-amino-7-oxononanoate synthase [Planctomycetota bacterium]|jgi:8-amino-7-oxononanoate synthase|nr:8-amino-7-oxononanoate synthase [Planctomycetota bacterium]OQC19671.1 MAG: 8-amino-7-oxononanoate synthase 2 [Planctomycetes bacterium ADurb.Bin069]HNR97880.1 8-amino-7-oxononanoate synthase [Planctomycetota bacterium]HNU24593.1 8-amino-7-oxononanoate synthase [Planctomycetota bacterium]HOE29015.1 8-amino-7-oxononanoate synthase [Planctomycetota bacterium]
MTRDDFAGELEKLASEGLLRTLAARAGLGGKYVEDGGTVLNFSSNDYLDLASDARLKAAAAEAIAAWGCGATASRLMAGSLRLHETLEAELAALAGRERALLFGSGFLANLGVLTVLAHRRTTIFADRLNHASLLDGARLSGARLVRYPHGDVDRLDALLAADGSRRRIIVTDSVFSMDGDIAPLAAIGDCALRRGALLVVDEAHAIGVLGLRGGGVCRDLPAVRPDVVVGTLSKALGGYGGFAAGARGLCDLLVNRARSFIYSTALPPACLGSARAALAILAASHNLGAALLARAEQFRAALQQAGLDTGPSRTHIIPIMVGDNERTLAFARALREKNILAVAVRPPTVPRGTARLRLSVTRAHTGEDLARAAAAIAAAARQVGVL